MKRIWLANGLCPLIILGIALGGCAPVSTNAPSTNDSDNIAVALSSDLETQTQAAWLLYGLTKSQSYSDTNGDLFATELEARKSLALGWRELREGRADEYLDQLIAIDDAGFMAEYVLAFFAQPGWGISAEQLSQLQAGVFLNWARENLATHSPLTFSDITLNGAPIQPSILGLNLPDVRAFVDKGKPNCTLATGLYQATEQWQNIRKESQHYYAANNGVDVLFNLMSLGSPQGRLEIVPRNVADLHILAGFCAIEASRHAQAEKYLATAIALTPVEVYARQEFTHSLINKKKFQRALEQINITLRLADHPCDIAAALRKRGFIEIEQGELKTALATYRESQQYEPYSPIADQELELLYQLLKEQGETDLSSANYQAPPSSQTTTTCSNGEAI